MSKRAILSCLITMLIAGVIANSAVAAGETNASYFGYSGTLSVEVEQQPIRYAEITSPTHREIVSGLVLFEAFLYNDDSDAGVQWAVRLGDCVPGGDTVFGNVDGKQDDYKWDGHSFSALADTSSWKPGSYCFVFNPKENGSEEKIRLERIFTIVEPEEGQFCGVRWKPPVRLENHVLNIRATMPIKFWLADCQGKPLRGDQGPDLVVRYLGDGEDGEETEYPIEMKRGTGGYQFIAHFRPEFTGSHEAVVTFEEYKWVQPFEVVEHGNGYGVDKKNSKEKLIGKEKDHPGNSGSPQNEKSKDKPRGSKPGKGRGRDKS